TLKRGLALEQPAETLEPVVQRPRRSLAVRLTAGPFKRVHGGDLAEGNGHEIAAAIDGGRQVGVGGDRGDVHGQAPSEGNHVVEVARARLVGRGRLVLFRLDRKMRGSWVGPLAGHSAKQTRARCAPLPSDFSGGKEPSLQ